MIEKETIEEVVKELNTIALYNKTGHKFKYIEEQYVVNPEFVCDAFLEVDGLIMIKKSNSVIMYSSKIAIQASRLGILTSLAAFAMYGSGTMIEMAQTLKHRDDERKRLNGGLGEGTTGEA